MFLRPTSRHAVLSVSGDTQTGVDLQHAPSAAHFVVGSPDPGLPPGVTPYGERERGRGNAAVMFKLSFPAPLWTATAQQSIDCYAGARGSVDFTLTVPGANLIA